MRQWLGTSAGRVLFCILGGSAILLGVLYFLLPWECAGCLILAPFFRRKGGRPRTPTRSGAAQAGSCSLSAVRRMPRPYVSHKLRLPSRCSSRKP